MAPPNRTERDFQVSDSESLELTEREGSLLFARKEASHMLFHLF